MELLFKLSGGTTLGKTNFKQHYPHAEGSMTFDEIQPTIRQATQSYILPFVGLEMYEAIASDYNSSNAPTGEKALVLQYLQDAIAHYTIYSAMPYMPFVVSSAGIQKVQPTEGAVSPTHGERKDTRWNAHIDGDRYLDEALKVLQNSEDSYFEPFKTFAAQNFKTSVFFKTTEALDEYLNIQGSRRAFSALVPYLKKAEESVIEPLLGESLYEHLQSDNLTTTEKTLIKKIQKIVANIGLSESVPFITLIIEGDGFKVVSRGDGIEERNGLKHKQHENAIIRLQDAASASGENYQKELIEFLCKKKADYPLWMESDYYISMTTTTLPARVICTGTGGIFLK
jgi:hypothetical protein